MLKTNHSQEGKCAEQAGYTL